MRRGRRSSPPKVIEQASLETMFWAASLLPRHFVCWLICGGLYRVLRQFGQVSDLRAAAPGAASCAASPRRGWVPHATASSPWAIRITAMPRLPFISRIRSRIGGWMLKTWRRHALD